MNAKRYANGQQVNVGINEINNSHFREYSNAPGMLMIEIASIGKKTLTVHFYDVTGKNIYNASLVCDVGRNLLECSIGIPGTFIVVVNGSSFKMVGNDPGLIEAKLVSASQPLKTVRLPNPRACYDYDNDNANGRIFGKLYTPAAALNANYFQYQVIEQGVCPDGWHVANDQEWIKLEVAMGMDSLVAQNNMQKFRGDIADKMRTVGTDFWDTDYGTDIFGFSAKGPGYYHSDNGEFSRLKQCATWWTYDAQYGLICREITDILSGVFRGVEFDTYWAVSVRCVKN